MTAPAVAVFDLDGTITRSDCTLRFLRRALLHRMPRPGLMTLPIDAVRHRLRMMPDAVFKQRVVRALLRGATRPEVDAISSAILPACLADVKPRAIERIAWHRKRGHRLILASASLDLYAIPIGDALGFETTLSTRTEWRDGRLTGAFDGPNLKGEAKRGAVAAAVGPGGVERVYAYSDHVSDLPLLQFADEGVAIDPHRALAHVAAETGLPIELWAD